MQCPNCGHSSLENSPECPSCGLIYSKWKERHEPSAVEAEAPPPRATEPPVSPEGPPAKKAAAEPFFPGWEAVRHPRTGDEKFLKVAMFFSLMGLTVFIVGFLLWISGKLAH